MGPEIIYQKIKGNGANTIVQVPPRRQMVHFARRYGGEAIVFNLPFPYVIFDITSMKYSNGYSSSLSYYTGTHQPIAQSLACGGLPLPALGPEGSFCTAYFKNPLPQASVDDSVIAMIGATLQSGHVWNRNYVYNFLYYLDHSFHSLVRLAGLDWDTKAIGRYVSMDLIDRMVAEFFPAIYDWWEAQETFPSEIPLNQKNYDVSLFTEKPVPLLKEK